MSDRTTKRLRQRISRLETALDRVVGLFDLDTPLTIDGIDPDTNKAVCVELSPQAEDIVYAANEVLNEGEDDSPEEEDLYED